MNNNMGKNLKTLSGNVHIDMVDEVLNFHSKGNITVDKKFNSQIIPYPLKYEQLHSLERSDFEISPFHDQDINCYSDKDFKIRRNRSAKEFSPHAEIHFSVIPDILHNAFAMREDGSRPYPSGGALYSIEVICAICSENIKAAPAPGFYHYRAGNHLLQPIKLAPAQKVNEVLYRMELTETKFPHFAFIYVMVISKMLVKYRYRGYRYALMETGAMFQQADLISKNLGLVNKLYSGFNDYELTKFIGLDRINFLPLVIQSFGVHHENAA